jgi:predicted nucleic acid-binding protein
MAERYGFSIYDGLIVAAGVSADVPCSTRKICSRGQVIDQLTIQNPFAGS